MTISPKSLAVKTSTIPGSGKGLFTKKFIPAGTRIIEYTGNVTAWKDADHEDGDNAYIYFVKRSYVIDARPDKKSLARYANDAKGLTRVKGITNNCEYVEDGNRVFIHSKRDIAAGAEILVPYGPEYWQVIRYNKKLSADNKKADEKAKAKEVLAKAKKKAKTATKKLAKTAKKKSLKSETASRSFATKSKKGKSIAGTPKGNLKAA